MAKRTVEFQFSQDRCFYLSGDKSVESIVKLRKEQVVNKKEFSTWICLVLLSTMGQKHFLSLPFGTFGEYFFDLFSRHLKLSGRSTMQNCTKLTRLHSPDFYISHVVHIARKHDVDS